ncbi:tRNA (guanine(46)-N(7))-methyltransferase TrmB, partial [Parvularcula oceani]|uniref:tRNA (guanine(46)-N(7))-methyltransferase TrmB n=1 Tax=Parvularcula oceani TaxID=1247963 RepID=UPI0005688B64
MTAADPRSAGYKDLRLFGRRQDKPLKPRQARLMESLLPELAVTPETVADVIAERRASPRSSSEAIAQTEERSSSEAIAQTEERSSSEAMAQSEKRSSSERERAVAPKRKTAQEVWLEVGFGGGEHLAWQAERHPDALLVGAEPFVNGVAKLLTQIEERRLSNVRICHGDARQLMAAMPDRCLSRLFVLHPDPWPKRKHHKRRIVSQPFLAEAARLLRPGAELRVSSDIPDYVRWTLMQVQVANREERRFEWTARAPSDWLDRPGDWPQTRYEAKALREGRRPAYLRFLRR